MCLSLHKPPVSYGDCIRACIATLIDDDNVPHTFQGQEPEESWKELRLYLASKNKFIAVFGLEDQHPFEFMKENNENIPYILLCGMENGEDHTLICKNDKIIHNPAYYKVPIKGKHSCGYWIIGIIGNLI